MSEKKGKLYVVATPIGNLKDITLRAIETLKTVDIIVCEDTRRAKKLLNYYRISNQLISYYKPKEHIKMKKIIDEILAGKDVALISDAGTPAISDPGQLLIGEARKNEIEVVAIPGPSSLITALSISGFDIVPFLFDGFIPNKKNDIKKRIEKWKDVDCSLVYFVPPRRLKDFLTIVNKILGERKVFIGRELTKIHEEIIIGTTDDLMAKSIVEKGEAIVIIERKENEWKEKVDYMEDLIRDAVMQKKTFKDIVKNDKFKNVKRNELYQLYEKIKKMEDNIND